MTRPIGFPLRGLGLLPLMVAMPLMYWPKIIDGDTQPWVSGAAVLAFLAYWPIRHKYQFGESLVVVALALAAIATFALRGAVSAPLLRYCVILGTFALLWLVGQRDRGELLVRAVRWCIVVWFVIGLYQAVAVRVGLPVTFVGRYVVGRSGVPSLTAEASFYGSISVIQIMYLVTNRDRRDIPYICMAAFGVLFSGSALALLMLAFPLARLPNRFKLLGGGAILVVLLLGYNISHSSFFQRLKAFDLQNASTEFILQDPSTNLRIGHAVFTFWDNIWKELTFQNNIGFQLEYFGFSERSGIFIPTGSDAILPSGGELLFRSGFIGLLLMAALLRHAWFTAVRRTDRLEKIVFVALCFVSPISLINPFFVFYIQKRYANP